MPPEPQASSSPKPPNAKPSAPGRPLPSGFSFHTPTRWRFGVGVFTELGQEAKRFGSRVLLMTGRRAMRELGILQRAVALLKDQGMGCTVFEGVSANPRTLEVQTAADTAREAGAEVVIGLGGGSVLDAAKATAATLACNQPVADLLSQATPITRSLPVIAIPTTAGTGSELSRGAILSDPERQFKGGLRGNGLFPALALVDPELSMNQPQPLARLTGFDVLCHAIETFFSRQAHAALEALSLTAVASVRDCLIQPRADESSRERGIRMAYASSLMGINLGNATTCLPHRMQYAIGALTDTAHPSGLAALYPEWFAAVVTAAPEKARRLLNSLFPDQTEAARALAEPSKCMQEILANIGVTTTLQELGVRTQEDLRWCVDHVSGASDVDPSYRGPQTVEQIFLSAYARGC